MIRMKKFLWQLLQGAVIIELLSVIKPCLDTVQGGKVFTIDYLGALFSGSLYVLVIIRCVIDIVKSFKEK